MIFFSLNPDVKWERESYSSSLCVLCKKLSDLLHFSYYYFKYSYFAPGRYSATTLCFSLKTLQTEPIHPFFLEVGGGGQSWRWCRCSVFFVAVEEEGQDSESCGGRFSALSGQQLQHLLPLSANHTGCYCSRQRWKKGGGVGWWRMT